MKIKKYLHHVGSVLAVFGIIFVVYRLHRYWQGMSFDTLSPLSWIMIGSLSVLYGVANLFLAQAWRSILGYFSINVSRRWVIYAYGTSQLAKYVPGNVFHIAGRQAIAMSAGLSGGPILKSNIIELIMISVLGGLAGWIVLNLVFPAFSLSVVCLLLLISFIAIVGLSGTLLDKCISKAIICQALFLLSSASIFTTILNLLDHQGILNFPMMISVGGAYTIAWLAGLVMPGAPAGIGVRELVMVFLLGNFIPDAELILAVLLGRIVTVLGDIMFFISAYAVGKTSLNGE